MIGHPDFKNYPAGFFKNSPGFFERAATVIGLHRTAPVMPPVGMIQVLGRVELSFDVQSVLDMANHATLCLEHRPSSLHYFDRRLWTDPNAGHSPQQIKLWRGKHIDTSQIPPALELVKDHGIYLMSNGIPVQRDTASRSSRVAYAKGFDPFKDGDWDEFARAYLGKRDFSIPIPLRWARRAQSKRAETLVLVIDRHGIHLG